MVWDRTSVVSASFPQPSHMMRMRLYALGHMPPGRLNWAIVRLLP